MPRKSGRPRIDAPADAPSGPRSVARPGLRVLRLSSRPAESAAPRPSCLSQRLGNPKSQCTGIPVSQARESSFFKHVVRFTCEDSDVQGFRFTVVWEFLGMGSRR